MNKTNNNDYWLGNDPRQFELTNRMLNDAIAMGFKVDWYTDDKDAVQQLYLCIPYFRELIDGDRLFNTLVGGATIGIKSKQYLFEQYKSCDRKFPIDDPHQCNMSHALWRGKIKHYKSRLEETNYDISVDYNSVVEQQKSINKMYNPFDEQPVSRMSDSEIEDIKSGFAQLRRELGTLVKGYDALIARCDNMLNNLNK